MKAFEWLLAVRYLKLLKGRSRRIYLVDLLFVAAAVAARVGLIWLGHKSPFLFDPRLAVLRTAFNIVELAGVCLAVLFFVLLWLIRNFTIFTSISTFGLYLGSAALVIVLSVMSGFEQDLKHKILGANAHIVVTAPDRQFTDYPVAVEKIRAVPGVASVTPFISNEVMVSSQANLAGVILKGIDPEGAAAVTDLQKNIEQGSLDHLTHPEKLLNLGGPPSLDDEDVAPRARPEPKPSRPQDAKPDAQPTQPEIKSGDRRDDKKPVEFLPLDSHGKPIPIREGREGHERRKRKVLPGILIGRELAKNLRVFVGDDVNMISPMGDIGPAGPMPRSRPFRVAGIFYSGMYEYDTKYAYMTIAAAQKFLGTDDEVTGVEVRIADPDHPQRIDEAIVKTLGSLAAAGAGNTAVTAQSPFDVQDWQELNRNLFSALKVEKIAMFVVLCFIILVAGFSIVANGIMLVREKEGEIAVLKAMGATDLSLLKTFLFIGLYMGVTGIGLGVATGVGACLYLARFGIQLDTDVYYINKLPVQMDPAEIAAVCFAALAIALAATVYPALVAARLRPVESLHQNG